MKVTNKTHEPAIRVVQPSMFGRRRVWYRRSGGVSLARMKHRVALNNRSGDGMVYDLVWLRRK